MGLILKSRLGLGMKAVGENKRFAVVSGLSVDKGCILGIVLSTVLGRIGIIVYAQRYSFFQLYQVPSMMAFPAVAAALIGGASTKNAEISHVILETIIPVKNPVLVLNGGVRIKTTMFIYHIYC